MNDPTPVAGRIWLRDYPPDVPAEIDPDSIPSLKHLYEDACRRHAPQVAFSNMGATLTSSGKPRQEGRRDRSRRKWRRPAEPSGRLSPTARR